MKKLFIFGDSYSCRYPNISEDYIKWKQYVPKNFGEIISDELKIEEINNAYQGSNNYQIFHKVFKEYDNINDGDIIIIGWSNVDRFRIVDNNNRWMSVFPYIIDNYELTTKAKGMSKRSLIEFEINRESSLYVEELNDFMNIINKSFKNCIIIHWSWVKYDDAKFTIPHVSLDSIYNETKGKINDGHLNESASKELSIEMLKYINHHD